MREAVIVSTARTPIGKAYRGALNNTEVPTLAGWAIDAAMQQAKVLPGEIDDCILGCALPQGSSSPNIGRLGALAAGCPVSVPGMTVDRQCSSGMMAIASASRQIVLDHMEIVVGGGVESISLVQTEHMNAHRTRDPRLQALHSDIYIPMLETAEIVAKRYGISRERQDEYSLQSQQRTAEAQRLGKFQNEIVPISAEKLVINKETKEVQIQMVSLSQDEGNRPETTIEALAGLRLVHEGGTITAGNASQLSDGASACIIMEGKLAEKRGLEPLGCCRGIAVAGCEPDEMGIGPVFAVPKLLKAHDLSIDDIDLWELNEAFAVQVLYCQDKLGIPNDILNVNGGSISIGHPYGMTGSRMVGHLLLEGKRRHAKYVVATMCIGGGMGAAGLFEVY